eukprot:gene2495-10136_t
MNDVGFNIVEEIALGPDRMSDNGGIYAPAVNARIHDNVVRNVSYYNFAGLGIYGEGG